MSIGTHLRLDIRTSYLPSIPKHVVHEVTHFPRIWNSSPKNDGRFDTFCTKTTVVFQRKKCLKNDRRFRTKCLKTTVVFRWSISDSEKMCNFTTCFWIKGPLQTCGPELKTKLHDPFSASYHVLVVKRSSEVFSKNQQYLSLVSDLTFITLDLAKSVFLFM